jgi:hypothetical protein
MLTIDQLRSPYTLESFAELYKNPVPTLLAGLLWGLTTGRRSPNLPADLGIRSRMGDAAAGDWSS